MPVVKAVLLWARGVRKYGCNNKTKKTYKRSYEEELRNQAVLLNPAPGITRTSKECISELRASNGLRIQNALASYEYSMEAEWERDSGKGLFPLDRRTFYARLMDRAKANYRFVVDAESKVQIAEYCASYSNNISTLDDCNVEIYKQVYCLLN